jgi:CRP-like cAMP-binding protein
MTPSVEGLYFVEKTKSHLPAGSILPSAFLSAFHPLSDKAARFIDSKAFFCTIPKGKFLLRQGQVCPYMFLVHKGLFRGFIMEGKAEITTWITAENDLVSSISSFFNQIPSLEFIQALEDAEMTGIYFGDLEMAYQKFPEVNVAARLIFQKVYRQAEERAYLTRLTKASSRYAYFQETKPELVNRVSLKYVASHLGMTLETLSRLRGAISRPYTEKIEK